LLLDGGMEVEVANLNDDGSSLRIELVARAESVLRNQGGLTFLNPQVFRHSWWIPEPSKEERRFPVELPYPHRFIFEATVERPPGGMPIQSLPEDVAASSHAMRFSRRTQVDADGALTQKLEFELQRVHVATEEWPAEMALLRELRKVLGDEAVFRAVRR
jgi:hypothetical protein